MATTLQWNPDTAETSDHRESELATGSLLGIGLTLLLETIGICLSLGHALHQVVLLVPVEGTVTLAAMGHAVTGGLVLARKQIVARLIGGSDES